MCNQFCLGSGYYFESELPAGQLATFSMFQCPLWDGQQRNENEGPCCTNLQCHGLKISQWDYHWLNLGYVEIKVV